MDLSNEELNIHFGKGAAKISEVKVRGRKKIADSALRREPKDKRPQRPEFFMIP